MSCNTAMKDVSDESIYDRIWTIPKLASHKYQIPQSENASTELQENWHLYDDHIQIIIIKKNPTASTFIDSYSPYTKNVENLKQSPTHQKLPQDVFMQISTVSSATNPIHISDDMVFNTHDTAAPSLHLIDTLSELFYNARDETFADGMNSSFSIKLNHIIQSYGMSAISALEKVMCARDSNVTVIEEALRQIGYIDDTATHHSRLSLLEHFLKSPDARIRDAASIGIEAMNDPAAINSLQKAIDREQNDILRQIFKDILAQLQDRR